MNKMWIAYEADAIQRKGMSCVDFVIFLQIAVKKSECHPGQSVSVEEVSRIEGLLVLV